DRATIGNMSPEYGATCAIFPVDAETLHYLTLTGRPEARVKLVEAYFKEQGLFYQKGAVEAAYSDTLELDLATVEPSLAGPKRPQDRVPLHEAKASVRKALKAMLEPSGAGSKTAAGDNPDNTLHLQRLQGEGGGGTAIGIEDPHSPAAAAHPHLNGGITHGTI